MGSTTKHPRADEAWAEKRVLESERRVGELLHVDRHGALLWEELERLRLTRAHLARIEFGELTADLRGHRLPRAKSHPSSTDDDPITEGDRPPDAA